MRQDKPSVNHLNSGKSGSVSSFSFYTLKMYMTSSSNVHDWPPFSSAAESQYFYVLLNKQYQ